MSTILAFSIGGITLWSILYTVILAIVCLLIVKVILSTMDKTISKKGIDKSLYVFLRTAVKVILLALVILIVAGSVGISVTSLVALLSVAALAVSLAVQTFMSNVVGGIQLLMTKPFTDGDFIEVGGTTGTVINVDILYTKLQSVDNKLIQIPNSDVVAKEIINYSANPQRRVDLTFTASYDAPIDQVKEVLQQVMGAHPLTLATPAPFAQVSKYGDHSIEYTIRVWCANGDYWTVYFDLIEQVKHAFDKAGIQMTYPHVNVHMV